MTLFLSILIIIPILLSGCEISISKGSDLSSNNSSTIENPSVIQNDNKYCFWEVTSKNSTGKLYLFGSIHAADDSAYPLTDAIMNAYSECDSIAVECNIVEYEKDIVAQTKMMVNMVYDDNTTIADHIDANTYEKLKQILVNNNSYVKTFDKYKPGVWLSLMESVVMKKSGLDDKKGIDRYFLSQAKKDEKEILEVESVQFQTDMLMGFSDEIMNLLLKSYADDFDLNVDMLNELYTVWKAGDTEKLYTIGAGDENKLTDEEIKLTEQYNKEMLTDRNIGMVEKAEQYLSDGKNVFFIVGAMHMVGEDGIVAQLTKKGYTVTRL